MHMDDERPMNEPADEPMDESLRDLVARVYEAPEGVVPRDAMWANISAARRAARLASTPQAAPDQRVEQADTPVIPIHRRQRTIWRWSAALAAGLVLGIAVDRALVQRASSSASGSAITSPVASAPTASVEQPAGVRGADSLGNTARSANQQVAVAAPARSGTQSGTRSTSSTGMPRVGAQSPSSTESTAVARANPSTPDANDLYHAAAVQTLVQAEALLTAYRRTGEAAPDPVAMQQAARWARDVLSSTRLLLDSPAARDPRMRVLFSDLELVLAQIVQLSGAPLQASERELIERALHDRDLLPRLRSAVPAGLTTS